MAFLKTQKPRRYNPQPLYWNPEEEKRREREKRIREELGIKDEGEVYAPDVKNGLRREFNKKRENMSRYSSSYTLRLFMVLIILLLVAFYLVTYKLDTILKFLG